MKKKTKKDIEFCCEMMKHNVLASFDDKGRIKYDDVDVIMNRWENGTYGIPIHDGGTSVIVIKYCPWCGKQVASPDEHDFEAGDRCIDVTDM